MRHSIKPLEKRKSNAFALRRKELQKRSENDTIENIETVSDFWNTATSKIVVRPNNLKLSGEDLDEKKMEFQNRVLPKKSFDDEYFREVGNVNISGISESALENECLSNIYAFDQPANNDYNNHATKENANKRISFHKNKQSVSCKIETPFLADGKEAVNKPLINNKSINSHDDVYLQVDSTEASIINNSIDLSSVEPLNSSVEYVADLSDSVHQPLTLPKVNSNKKFKYSISKRLSETRDVKYSLPDEECYFSEAQSFIRVNDKFSYVENIEAIDNSKSQVAFLLNTRDIETGILFLNHESYLEQAVADRSFSMLVLKGGIEFILNGLNIFLRKNGLVVINKGDVYSLKNLKNYSTRLFFTYSLN